MKHKITIQDIAKLAGVSKATVSRVLNQKPTVAPAIREHVLKIVEEYDFVPNMTAALLRGGQTQFVSVLIPPLRLPVVDEIMIGVTEAFSHTLYKPILLHAFDEEYKGDAELDQLLAARHAGGILAILPGCLTPRLEYLSQQGTPIVIIDDQEPEMSVPWVGIDNRKGAYEATRHLLDCGYTRIGHILGPTRRRCSQERYEGYCQALRAGGIEPDERFLWQGDFCGHSGREIGRALFSLPPEERPQALFSGNDLMAIGVLQLAEEQGVRVPDDLALVGFDDMPLLSYIKPGLTTVRQPHQEMGWLGCELLLSLIDPHASSQLRGKSLFASENRESQPQRIVLPTRVVIRETCGARASS